jgi:hypothetical protein
MPHNLLVGEPKHKSRRWPRLSIAFPVFLHGFDAEGGSMLEFGTAVNVSAGGALVAVKRVPKTKEVTLEMPVPPGSSPNAPTTHRIIASRIVRLHPGAEHTYLGLEFAKPLLAK